MSSQHWRNKMRVKFEKENLEHQTPLGRAAFVCDVSNVNQLLSENESLTSTECTADTNQSETFWGNYGDQNAPCSKTPLYWAIKGGNCNIVRAILMAHKEQSLKISDFCLDTAAMESNIEVINLLIDEGDAPINDLFFKTFLNDRAFIMQELLKKGVDHQFRDERGNTFLHLINSACGYNRQYPLDSVVYFSSLFDTIDLKNTSGHTPLHSACMGRMGHRIDIMHQLLQIPQFRNMILDRNESGETILHLSCKNNLSLAKNIISVCSEDELSVIKDEIIMILEQEKACLAASMERDIQSGYWDGLGMGEDDEKINDIGHVIRQLNEKITCCYSRVKPRPHSSAAAFFTVKPKERLDSNETQKLSASML